MASEKTRRTGTRRTRRTKRGNRTLAWFQEKRLGRRFESKEEEWKILLLWKDQKEFSGSNRIVSHWRYSKEWWRHRGVSAAWGVNCVQVCGQRFPQSTRPILLLLSFFRDLDFFSFVIWRELKECLSPLCLMSRSSSSRRPFVMRSMPPRLSSPPRSPLTICCGNSVTTPSTLRKPRCGRTEESSFWKNPQGRLTSFGWLFFFYLLVACEGFPLDPEDQKGW